MPSERDDFLAAIAADPLDCQLRAIYADWLEQQGIDYEEAARQRRWPEIMAESKRWLADFAQRIGGLGRYDEPDEEPLTLEELIAAADHFVETGEHHFMGTNESYTDEYHRMDEFWEHYQIVTGRQPKSKQSFFSCAC